nr:MAG TPA: hypothetical protein [Caudoviricetes sp.]
MIFKKENRVICLLLIAPEIKRRSLKLNFELP